MDDSREALRSRSINQQYTFWQEHLLASVLRTDKFSYVTLALSDKAFDNWRSLNEQMMATLFDVQIKEIAKYKIAPAYWIRYTLSIPEDHKQKLIHELSGEYEPELSESIITLIEIFSKETNEFGEGKDKNDKTLGTELFNRFGDISEMIARYHPESAKKLQESLDDADIGMGSEDDLTRREKKERLLKLREERQFFIDLQKIPFTTQVLFFTALSRCRIFLKLSCSPPTSKLNRLEFITAWFKGFKHHYSKFIVTKTDITILKKKEIRQLRERLWGLDMDGVDIFSVAASKNYARVRELIIQGCDVDTKNAQDKHRTLLHYSALNSDWRLLEICKEFNANPNVTEWTEQTPIFYAIEQQNLEMVNELIKMGTDLSFKDKNSGTCFYWAVHCSNLAILKALYDGGSKVVTENMLGRDPLIKACFLDKSDITEWLLQFPEVIANINRGDSKNRTSTHAACWGPKGGREGKKIGGVFINDSARSLELLLQHGADVGVILIKGTNS